MKDLEAAHIEENDKWLAFLDANYARQQAQLDLLHTTGQLARCCSSTAILAVQFRSPCDGVTVRKPHRQECLCYFALWGFQIGQHRRLSFVPGQARFQVRY